MVSVIEFHKRSTVGFPSSNDASTPQPIHPNLRDSMGQAPRLLEEAEDQGLSC